MLLIEEKLEFHTIRTICDGDKKLSGILLASIDKTYFASPGASEAFARIMTQVRTRGTIPAYSELSTDAALTEDTKEELASFRKKKPVQTDEAMKTLVTQLSDYRKARILFENADAVIKTLGEDSVDLGKLVDKASNAVALARSTMNLDKKILNIGTNNNSKKLVRDLLSNNKVDFIPMGFSAFDEKNGGLFPGSLVTIAATSGGGKSTLANQIGMNMSEWGADVALVPLEMTEKESMARVLANLGQVDVTKFLMGKITKNERAKVTKAYEKWIKALKKVNGKFSIFEPEEDMTAEEILMMLHPYGYKVIIIDYISLLKGVDGDDSWQQLGKVARACKVYAKVHNVIVIMLAQLSDEGAIRYSRAIVEHSNNAFFWTYTDENAETGIIDIRQAKARNQSPFPFQLAVDFSTMTIRDVSERELSKMNSDKGNKKRKNMDKLESEIEEYLKDETDSDD